MLRRSALAALIAVSLVPAAFANRQAPAPTDTAYPGTIKIAVDATDLTRRIFRVTEEMPVVAGPLSLHYPQWLPGSHSPSGPIDKLAGLVITANRKRLSGKPRPADLYPINLVIPEGRGPRVGSHPGRPRCSQGQLRRQRNPLGREASTGGATLWPAAHSRLTTLQAHHPG